MKRDDPFLVYLDSRRDLHRKALAELDVAERHYRESGIKPHFAFPPATGPSDAERSLKPKSRSETPASKKQMILGLIDDATPHGRTSAKILELIQGHFDASYPRKNLAPKLTNYRHAGLVVLDAANGVWKITEKGQAFLAKG